MDKKEVKVLNHKVAILKEKDQKTHVYMVHKNSLKEPNVFDEYLLIETTKILNTCAPLETIPGNYVFHTARKFGDKTIVQFEAKIRTGLFNSLVAVLETNYKEVKLDSLKRLPKDAEIREGSFEDLVYFTYED